MNKANSNSDVFFWQIDQTYKDIGVKLKADGYHADDEFTSKVSIDRKQNWGIANASGIRILSSGLGDSKDKKQMPAAVFLVTTHPASAFHNPWEDFIDYTTGMIRYWGDAKFRIGYQVNDWKGNAILSKIAELVLRGEYASCPPILYFVKEEKSQVVFKGLCTLESLEKTWFEDSGKRVLNYRCTLSILNAEKVYPEWLIKRARGSNVDPESDIVPKVWIKYIKTGHGEKLFSWTKKIRNKDQQRPLPNSPGEVLLKQLEKMDPFLFEKVICKLLESYREIVHRVFHTRNVRDGGFDMEGEFILPPPFNYPIRFKGEVKRHKSAIGPAYVSRLVARLERGEYGLFFTTGCFTDDAQKEVIEDNYPVRLISGADLYDFFYEARVLDEKGIQENWLREVTS